MILNPLCLTKYHLQITYNQPLILRSGGVLEGLKLDQLGRCLLGLEEWGPLNSAELGSWVTASLDGRSLVPRYVQCTEMCRDLSSNKAARSTKARVRNISEPTLLLRACWSLSCHFPILSWVWARNCLHVHWLLGRLVSYFCFAKDDYRVIDIVQARTVVWPPRSNLPIRVLGLISSVMFFANLWVQIVVSQDPQNGWLTFITG